ncbi:MAG: hypothetical protein A3G83_16745 [Betaproteobacteria bacterium RIFCSPLOWO2_12_FULL_68_20]|nr:MAG: hypothetical protein A3G83_16745 [Betaproteobacteria bacterium RIFCSPLOWO2_12_FULL_68_20]
MVIESGSDTLDVVQSSVSYALSGGLENLTLTGSSSIDGAGNELNNLLVGNAGANVLNGLAGADTMQGMAGADTYYVDDAADVVDESPTQAGGVDTVFSEVDVNLTDAVHFKGTLENVTLLGSADLDATGNSSANALVGNLGQNELAGGTGNDTYYVDRSDSVAEASSSGTDIVYLDVGVANGTTEVKSGPLPGSIPTAEVELWNVENVTLLGMGDFGIKGSAAANKLVGNIGSNRLDGGTGNDTLTGEAGDDLFTFSTALSSNVDHITDFQVSGDLLALDDAIFSAIGSALDANEFRAAAGATSGADSDDRIVLNTSNGNTYYDADGNGAGASVLFAVIDNSGAWTILTHADFAIV